MQIGEPEMATPRSDRLTLTPTTTKHLSITPGSRVLRSPLSDDEIWKRLKQAGFDEESIRQKDKAALVAYIAKLEAEVCLLFMIFFFFSFL